MRNRLISGGGGALAATVMAIGAREAYRRLKLADISEQSALVTGGSRGLGFLVARELARAGCRVTICARTESQLERARLDLIKLTDEQHILAVVCDVSDRDSVERMVEEARLRFGEVDLLVNNAGIIQVGPAESMTLENFEECMNVMFWGVVHPTLAVLPTMLERGAGRIVNITSVGGKVSVPHLLPYSCAKFAATAFSEGLAAEVAQRGVAVTTIAPGVMRTGSYVNIAVRGDKVREFGWFALASSLPLITMDAERAARQIVRATRRGDTERILSTQANALARFHGLFPGTTVELMGVVNRLLPDAQRIEGGTETGRDVGERINSRLLHAATYLGRQATQRFNQPPPA